MTKKYHSDVYARVIDAELLPANILSVNRFVDFLYEKTEKNITQMFMVE